MALGEAIAIRCICCKTSFMTQIGGDAACEKCRDQKCENCKGFIRRNS